MIWEVVESVVSGVKLTSSNLYFRFHALQEFDEGKRSCRRRLAGHNKRRRKTQTENVSNNSPVNNNQTSSYLLMSILKILSSMHCKQTLFLHSCYTICRTTFVQ